jgi:hypothetical protein
MSKLFIAKPKLLTIPRFAEEVGVCVKTVKRAIKAGEIKAVDVGMRRYVPMSELARVARQGA